jgi:hypothetical protein
MRIHTYIPSILEPYFELLMADVGEGGAFSDQLLPS